MIPFDVDPSLHTAEPEAQMLGDGFSPPQHHAESDAQADDARPVPPEPVPPPPRQRS